MLDSVHNFYYMITEIYIPKYKIVFNEKGGIFKIDKNNKSRLEQMTNVEDIEITQNDVNILINYCLIKNGCQNIIKSYFPDYKP